MSDVILTDEQLAALREDADPDNDSLLVANGRELAGLFQLFDAKTKELDRVTRDRDAKSTRMWEVGKQADELHDKLRERDAYAERLKAALNDLLEAVDEHNTQREDQCIFRRDAGCDFYLKRNSRCDECPARRHEMVVVHDSARAALKEEQ